MPPIRQLAIEVLGEEVTTAINFLDCESVDDFLKYYPSVRSCNSAQFSSIQAVELLRCAVIARFHPIVKDGNYLSQRALKNTVILSTESKKVDKTLEGGFYTCEVIEVYGQSGVGKTQFGLYTTAVACYKHHSNVIYIDTGASFTPQRVTEFLEKLIPDAACRKTVLDKVLKKIIVHHCFDVFELLKLVYNLMEAKKAKTDDFKTKVKLLIIDSITSLLSPLIGYKSPEGYSIANTLALALRKLAHEHFVTVMIINGTVSSETTSGYPRPALGSQWQQTSDRRLLITSFKADADGMFDCILVKNSEIAMAAKRE